MSGVGANVRRIRCGQRLTLAELSHRIGAVGGHIGVNALSRVERGDRRMLVDDLLFVAAALNVDPSELLGPLPVFPTSTWTVELELSKVPNRECDTVLSVVIDAAHDAVAAWGCEVDASARRQRAES